MGDRLLDHGAAESRGATESDVRPEERKDLCGLPESTSAKAALGTMSSPYSCTASCPSEVHPEE